MLNVCGIVRPMMIIVWIVAMASIVAPTFFIMAWPYLAAASTLLVPVLVYRWWNTRYNPGCGVHFKYEAPDTEEAPTR